MLFLDLHFPGTFVRKKDLFTAPDGAVSLKRNKHYAKPTYMRQVVNLSARHLLQRPAQ